MLKVLFFSSIIVITVLLVLQGSITGAEMINGYDVTSTKATTTTTTTTTKVPTTTMSFGLNDFQDEIELKSNLKIDRINHMKLKLYKNNNEKFEVTSDTNMTFVDKYKWVHYNGGTLTHECKNDCTLTDYKICEGRYCINYPPINIHGEWVDGLVNITEINSKLFSLEYGDEWDPEVEVSIGLIFNMTMDNSTGLIYNSTFAEDALGLRNGTVTNATYNVTGGRDGTGAYEFDGSGDYILLPTDTFSDSENFSLSIWVKPKARTNVDSNKLVLYDLEGYFQHLLNYIAVNQSLMGFNNGSSKYAWVTDNYGMNEWHHLLQMKNKTHGLLYFDGVLANSTIPIGGQQLFSEASRSSSFGSTFDGAEYFFNGSIDDILIYDSALNNSQIQCLYDETTCTDYLALSVIVPTNTSYASAKINYTIEAPSGTTLDSCSYSYLDNPVTPDLGTTMIVSGNKSWRQAPFYSIGDYGTTIYFSCNDTDNKLNITTSSSFTPANCTGGSGLVSCISEIGNGCGVTISNNCAVIS